VSESRSRGVVKRAQLWIEKRIRPPDPGVEHFTPIQVDTTPFLSAGLKLAPFFSSAVIEQLRRALPIVIEVLADRIDSPYPSLH
jgi:hypothetical protein